MPEECHLYYRGEEGRAARGEGVPGASLCSLIINRRSGGMLGRSEGPKPEARRQRTGISIIQDVFFSLY